MFNSSTTVTFFIVALALLAPTVVSSADKKVCEDTAKTQPELNQCAISHLKAADAELNRVYQAILEKYKDDRAFLEKLRNAQRAWLTFRDAELDAKFPFEDKQRQYGSAYPMCANNLLARLTQERINQLRAWLEGTEEGDVCAGSVHYESSN